MKTYSGKIINLGNKQVWVFGSNTEGRHGKGAALFAMKKCGAIYGKARGPQGRSYAIITKNLRKRNHPSVSKEFIIEQIGEFYEFAKKYWDLEFLIAYSGIGANLNGYSNQEMADMFSQFSIPDNIVFEKQFSKLLLCQSL